MLTAMLIILLRDGPVTLYHHLGKGVYKHVGKCIDNMTKFII